MKIIVVYSGGLDSTVLLAMTQRENEVKALSVNYGQRHERELDAARHIARELNVQHEVVDLRHLHRILKGSSQTDPKVPVPLGHYEEESMKQTVVPNRNMILLAVAGAWAISLKFDAITYAAHAGDHAIYPDCREEFVQPLTLALEHADWHRVTILRPFLKLTKAEIVKAGDLVHAPLHLTYSCYQGGSIHCGKCGTCTERQEAFKLAGVKDPTVYLG